MAHTPPGRTRERIFRFVRERLAAGRPPTVREVQEAFGFRAVESARAQLEALVAEGRLTKDAGRSRGYGLPGRPASMALVPVLGRVQAGALTEAIEEADGFVAHHARRPGEELFALRVQGESMRDAAILDGDVVIVRRHAKAESGRIVVAMVGGEATVKTLRLVPERQAGGRRLEAGGKAGQGFRVELHPANPDFQPIVPAPEDVEILGPVIEVRRNLERQAGDWRLEAGGKAGPSPSRSSVLARSKPERRAVPPASSLQPPASSGPPASSAPPASGDSPEGRR